MPIDKLLDMEALADGLQSIGLAEWSGALEPLLARRFSDDAHGNFAHWRQTIRALPDAASDKDELRQLLLALSPWRKGPLHIGGVEIDAEWRSDLKWARVADAIQPLANRNVLDVGCGNGYYALQMRKAGANFVIGIDPTLIYVMQFLAVNVFGQDNKIFVLPLRLDELPSVQPVFDTTFSMGVLYHQRSPIEHLRQLRGTLRQGGQLVLETIYMPGEESYARTPTDRYARMRNVWHLPTIAELTTWMRRCGYRGIEIIDRSITTTHEQRSTEWMTFESLLEALDPEDPSKTVEGWPAPHRVVITATCP